jgi:hypothetical protein
MWSLSPLPLTISAGFVGSLLLLDVLQVTTSTIVNDPNSVPLNLHHIPTIIGHVQQALIKEGLNATLSGAQIQELVKGIRVIGDIGGRPSVFADSVEAFRNTLNSEGLSVRSTNLESLIDVYTKRVNTLTACSGVDSPTIDYSTQQEMRNALNRLTAKIVDLGYQELEQLSKLNPQVPIIVGGGVLQSEQANDFMVVAINNLGSYFGNLLVDHVHEATFKLKGLYSYSTVGYLADTVTPLDQMLSGIPEVEATLMEEVPPVEDFLGDGTDSGDGGESKFIDS